MSQDFDEKGVKFLSKNLRTEDFFPVDQLDGRTFDMIGRILWERLSERKVELPNRGNEAASATRFPIQFRYDRDGTKKQITGAQFVLDFVAQTGETNVEYYYETMGG